jgi:hypothetical protein
MRYTCNQKAFLPADELKNIRWSVSDDKEGHDLVLGMAKKHDKKRAEFTRAAQYLGMYYIAMAEGDIATARKIEKRLIDHGILPKERLVIKEELLKTA